MLRCAASTFVSPMCATDPSERTVELIRTLARYFREDGSPQRTAKVLSVHPNTVGYRLRRFL